MSVIKSNQELIDELGLLRAIARNLYRSLDVMTQTVDYNGLDVGGDVENAEECMNRFSHYWANL